MADTVYTWGIAQLDRHTADGVVYTAHYTINAADGTYSAGAYGSVGLEQPNSDNIIPFADLTPELVIGWVQEKLGGDEKVEEIEAAFGRNTPARIPSTGHPAVVRSQRLRFEHSC